jgi:sulfonate transport system substrate-binding protein
MFKKGFTRRDFLKTSGAVAGAALGGSMLDPFSASAKKRKQFAVRLGESRAISNTSWWFARDLYKPDWVIWNWVDLGEWAAGRFTALQRGLLDISTIPMTYVIRGVSQGYDFKAFQGVCGGTSRIVAHKDTNIYKLEDLKGKRIGILKFSSQDVYLILALAGVGLDWQKDVKRVDLANPATVVGALQKKEIDAASIWDPWGSKMIVEGFGRNVPGIYKYWSKMHQMGVARTDFVEAAPQALQAVTNAVVKGIVKCNNDAKGWAEKAHLVSGVDLKACKLSIENAIPDVTIDIEDTKKLARKMYELGVIKKDVEGIIENHITYDFVSKATHQPKEKLTRFGYCPKTIEEVG